jgi:hypothetical protein
MASGKPLHGASARLVERQMRNWELARSQRPTEPAPAQKEVEDFIAISRAVGAGGLDVATRLGEALEWPVFDREILEIMAGDNELRKRIYASMDERDMGWCEETLQVLLRPEFVKNDYFRRLTKTVLTLARQGHAVFLGRGADLILPRNVGFRVRLVASHETCVANYTERHGLSPAEAEKEIARVEKERAEFIQHHFQTDAASPMRHDLIINVERFTATQAVEVILNARSLIGGIS